MLSQIIGYTILRSLFAFILLVILTRIMGRKVISGMTFFDFVISIVMGSIGASLALKSASSAAATTVALITFAFLVIGTDFLHTRSVAFTKLVNSEPVVIIENGKINNQNMEKTRFNLEDLSKALREKNVFNMGDVEFALLENDGKLSVLLKSQKQPLTPLDMHVSTPYVGLTRDIIVDGRIMDENIEGVNLDREWLLTKLAAQGIKDEEEVFYAGLDTLGNLYVSKKKLVHEQEGKYGIE